MLNKNNRISLLLNDLRFHVSPTTLPVRAEQLRVRLAQLPKTLITSAIAEIFFVVMLWEKTVTSHLLIWLGCLLTLHIVVMLGIQSFQNGLSTETQCRTLSRRLTLAGWVTGLVWGVGVMHLYPLDLWSQFFVICVMVGMVAGATMMNPTHLPSLFAYVLCMILPLTFRVLIEHNEIHWGLGLMLLLFLIAMMTAAQFLNRLIYETLVQRFSNITLASKLTHLNADLEIKVEARTAQLLQQSIELEMVRDVTIVAMGILADARDEETGNHLKRTQNYMRVLAVQLRNHPRFQHFLNDANIETLVKMAPLHDIGKVGIPDYILNKPGKLTAEEFEIMKRHPTLGGEALAAAESSLPAPSKFLHIGREIASSHHEKWDGSGYPQGLRGDDIPISARLMAIADVYDALISKRPYKVPFSHALAEDFIRKGRGNHFDPDVTDAFLALQDEFQKIAKQYED